MSYASHTDPPTYLPLEFIHIYNNVKYCSTTTTTRDIFIFRVLKKPLEAVFFLSFFCNALAGRRGSYQIRKLTHYLLTLFLLALCFALLSVTAKFMASRSQHPQPRHTAQIGGLVIRAVRRCGGRNQLSRRVETKLVESKDHNDLNQRAVSFIHDLAGYQMRKMLCSGYILWQI